MRRNIMNDYKKLIVFIFALFLISTILAVPPVTQVSSYAKSLTISYPPFPYAKLRTQFDLNFHVYNETAYKTNATTNCSVHIYNIVGEHILSENAVYDPVDGDFYVIVDANNFTEVGYHSSIIQCISNNKEVGFANTAYEVTRTGNEFLVEDIALPLIIIFSSFLLFLLGNSFSKEKYILKTSMYITSLISAILSIQIAGLIMVNRINGNMLLLFTSGLVILISITSFMFLYAFIIWMINTFKAIKDKKEIRWQY